MICPVCKRDLAPTLSICFACGAMMNDTVREELETKVTPVSGRLKRGKLPAAALAPQVELQPPPAPVLRAPVPPIPTPAMSKPAPVKTQTSPLAAKKTSPTLVGFQPKKAALPEWRLQLQNSVRQRSAGLGSAAGTAEAVSSSFQKQLVTNGANALKADFVEEEKPVEHENPRVAKALKRIEESRKSFTPAETPSSAAPPLASARNYPFNVVSRSSDVATKQNPVKPDLSEPPKPRLVSSLRIEKKKFDTNKLPPLPEPAKISTSFEGAETPAKPEPAETLREGKNEQPKPIQEQFLEIETVETEVEEVEEHDEIDDLAPLPLRFNAALFDLIVGGFVGLAVLSPFILSGGDWLSLSGVLAITAGMAIVTFIYLTIAIGIIGRTIGMKLFSLELIDAEENQYPTLHQAAVHSSLFIFSLAFAGLGFVPMFFNEERRAAHDLLSGTILVREC